MNNNIKILQVGSTKDKFLVDLYKNPDNIREKFYIDKCHMLPNIDELNSHYCEITALYYLIKHYNQPIIGLTHYRTDFFENNRMQLLLSKTIQDTLKEKDIIIGKWDYNNQLHGKSLRTNFNKWLNNEIELFFDKLTQYDKDFSYFLNDYVKMTGGYHMACNCFIGKREIIEEYFDYFFSFTKYFQQFSPMSKNNLRREGWISEVMFGAWLEKHNCNISWERLVKHKKDLKSIIQTTNNK